MVLPLIPVIGLGFLVTFLVLYGMTHGLQTWLASLLNALAHPQGSFWKVAALKAVGAIVGAAAYVFRTVGHAVSQSAAHSIPRVAHWLDGLAAWVTLHATIAGQFADEVAAGFERLVAHTIPRAVSRAIAIPIHEVQIGLRHAERDLELLRRYARGIDRLVRHTIWPDVLRLAHAIDITLPRTIGKVRSRVGHLERDISNPTSRWVKAIWKRGWILVGAGLMLRFLVRKFPHLFCRNTTRGLKALCGLPSSVVDILLGEAIGLLLLTDICDTVLVVEKVAEGFDPILRDLVGLSTDVIGYCGKDLPSAHDPAGYSGGWQPTAT